MKVRDYVKIIDDAPGIDIVYDGKKFAEFRAPFWTTIEADILDLEIRSVKFPSGKVVIETKTGRPTIVSTLKELEAAIEDSYIKFIKLGADIEGSFGLADFAKVIDLAGHEITGPEYAATILVAGEGKLDIFDSEGGGLINGTGAAETISADEKGRIYLHGGDYVGGNDDEYLSATVVARGDSQIGIYGGYFVNLYNDLDPELNKVLYADDSAQIMCLGGKFKAEDPTPYLVSGYQAVEIPDTDPVVYAVKAIL